jgi:methylmalonyl-CoA mutase N-terminal domain/subunit
MAAVAGGCQTLATSSFDEAFSIPTEEAVTVALRTQQIVAYESGITQTVDIMGGSYACEALTDKIEAEIWSSLAEVEKRGGAVQCIEEGYFQRILSDGAYRFQKSVDDGERVIVGVNKFRDDKEPQIPTFKLSDETGRKQSDKLAGLRASRDNIRVERALDAVRRAAQNDDNLGDVMIEACDAYATMGESCDVLKEVYGVYAPLKIY